MAAARKIINPKSTGVIKFAASQAGLGAGTDLTCQITSFLIKPKPNLVKAPATFAEPAVDVPAATSWEVVVDLLQDWGATVSVSKYFFDNDGSVVWFRIDPAGATEDSFEGKCYALASAFGGKADENWVDSLTLPCPVKPTRVDAA